MNRLPRLSIVSRHLLTVNGSAKLIASNRSFSLLNITTDTANSVTPSYSGFRCSTPHVTKRFAGTISTQTTGLIQFKLADVGEGIAECEILKWHVKLGDRVKEFDPLCEVQSDKATVEITSRYDGIIRKIHYNTGNMAKVGSPLVDIDLGGEAVATGDQHVIDTLSKTVVAGETEIGDVATKDCEVSVLQSSGPVLTTPAVRHIAKSKGVNLAAVKGTGKEGRILKEDIVAHIQRRENASKAPPPPPAVVPKSAPTFTLAHQKEREEVVALTGIRRVMARAMTTAAAVPHFGFCDEFAMDQLQNLRSSLKPVAEKRNIKLTYMPFFIKAASLALKQYPIVNASINNELTEIILKHYHNIGVAMDTPHGLIVPNIKDVQDKSIFEIAQELTRLHHSALNNQLTPADLSGGTFTLSNIGTIGGTYASPVLVLPEVAIGAIGKIQKVPRYDSKGNLLPIHLLQVSWSADHRAIDGATMANFSNAMKLYVERPEAMIVDLR